MRISARWWTSAGTRLLAGREVSLPNNQGERVSLKQTNEERDLGIILTPDFKFSAQSAHAASKANSILSMLKRAFVSRDPVLWGTLYRTYVRPHLEFAISAWNPKARHKNSRKSPKKSHSNANDTERYPLRRKITPIQPDNVKSETTSRRSHPNVQDKKER